ncbi:MULTISPECIES: hypothetical protein [Bradyrhizobium]|uniref:hypothetical protein n=1 Tax=Bradyrhizobium TaxID=374 RepID=UPI0004ACB4A4|nr:MULTISPECIES: hypothetical protein [Bradyrhizobium]MDI2078204.1 hypothetical protein [Bradyrhizobium sp. Mp27]
MALKWRGLIAVLECDSCNAEIESKPGETFDEFTERRKAAGWTASRVGNTQDYTHGCKEHGA